MHVKKGEEYVSELLLNIPDGIKLVVFGCYDYWEIYYAFLAPLDTKLKVGQKIVGVRYAEGGKDGLELLDSEVSAFRREDGGYDFKIKDIQGPNGVHFRIFPDSRGESTYENGPIRVILFRYAE
jgi:hypothetical protein